MRERSQLLRVKRLCGRLGLPNAAAFKLLSFRHPFASLCANHQVTYRKSLAWLGHSDSSILRFYHHRSDSDSQAAMAAVAGDGFRPSAVEVESVVRPGKGILRAAGQSTTEIGAQNEAGQLVIEPPGRGTERGGFEPPIEFPQYSISSAAPSAARTPLP